MRSVACIYVNPHTVGLLTLIGLGTVCHKVMKIVEKTGYLATLSTNYESARGSYDRNLTLSTRSITSI